MIVSFLKNRYFKLFVASLLFVSCIIEITNELGMHELDEFGVRHGIAVFAFTRIIIAFSELTDATDTIDKNIR